jgi:hypothetical protein
VGDDATISGTTQVADLRYTVLEVGSVSGTLNDWAPTGHETVTQFAVTGTGTLVLNGLQGGASGRRIVITNMAGGGVADITINNENAGSSAANRFDMATGANWRIQTGESATFIYNGTSSRWVHLGHREFPTIAAGSSTFSSTVGITGTLTVASINAADDKTTTFQGHIGVNGGDPTLSSCGTSPTILGNDTAGIITVGTTPATSCTVTFTNTFTAAPVCVLTGNYNSGEPFFFSAKSATAFTFTTSTGGDFAGAEVNYICFKR